MAARLLDGSALASQIRDRVRERVVRFTRQTGRSPGLGIVLVGEHPASEIYVRNKVRAAGEVGIASEIVRLPATATVEETLGVVDRLNASPTHDGVLVQTPLPAAMGRAATQRLFDALDPAKDVDGLHPVNVGRLVQNRALLAPCTPSGIMVLLDHAGVRVAGARVVVLGRSEIVGKPIALMLMHRDATVTICHSKTPDLPAVAATADIVVAAVGRPAFVTSQFIKPGATVIDVGITRLTDAAQVAALLPPASPKRAEFERRRTVLIGDVHPDVGDVAGALTPVPGGVGPLTVAMLLSNTVTAAEARFGQLRSE